MPTAANVREVPAPAADGDEGGAIARDPAGARGRGQRSGERDARGASLDDMRSCRPRLALAIPARVALSTLALVLVAAGVAGCGAATRPPSPTPADFPGITRVLGVLGVTVSQIVSGDAGCADAHLAPTAISFVAGGLDQPSPVALHVYIFRDADAFQRNMDAVDTCARSFVTDPAAYEKLEASPFVLVGQGPWGSQFAAALAKGLKQAATLGG